MKVGERSGEGGRAPLLSLDPDLARRLDPSQRQVAHNELRVSTGKLSNGSWQPPTKAPVGVDLGLVVLRGALVREVTARTSSALELLGPGDLIRPWQEDSASFCEACWQVLQPTNVALLDRRVVAEMAKWPQVMTALVERGLRRSRWLVAQSAISSMVGVEKRLQLTLWHIAEKWGRRENGAVVIDVPMTHDLLAEMIGITRPYLTQALSRVRAEGLVTRGNDGRYVLHGESPSPTVGVGSF